MRPLVFGIVVCAQPLFAAEVIHYWDFDTLDGGVPSDVVGGLATGTVGAPDVSVHATYGEAYAGSGNSLNSTMATPNFLVADVFDDGLGAASALQFGTESFSYSYWSWDASDLDGDVRGPRVFDCLDGTNIGIQLASNIDGIFNYRMDDDRGVEVISNNILGTITQEDAKWIHIAVNVDRDADMVEIFFDTVSQGTYSIAVLEGIIEPGQDMQIGVINGGTNAGTAQQCGLDDLAFYDGLLSASDIAGLADASLKPTDIVGEPEAPFEITSVTVDPEGVVTLTWNSIPGIDYAVDFSADMQSWIELLDDHPSGGTETSFQHTPGEERAFYQAREAER